MITEEQFKEAAALLKCEIAAVKAVNKVESGGRSSFLADGRPKILFEGHIFWKELLKLKIDPKQHVAGNEDILYPSWILEKVRPFYRLDQHVRLAKARLINQDAANKSASWGAFQIMGNNHAACGYAKVADFVAAQTDEYKQLLCFCTYLKSTHIDLHLQHLDWKGFARAYNGADYAKNQYDTKLQAAYLNFK